MPGAAWTWYYNQQYMEEAGGFTVQGFIAYKDGEIIGNGPSNQVMPVLMRALME